ncbi:hypothetical protein T492DRAFT_1104605 [Pavlovales sp. CCMP2436]|nr:hypothetical protein T492DRAFT_1104605 [Pavlovales sp. CCMP2436]
MRGGELARLRAARATSHVQPARARATPRGPRRGPPYPAAARRGGGSAGARRQARAAWHAALRRPRHRPASRRPRARPSSAWPGAPWHTYRCQAGRARKQSPPRAPDHVAHRGVDAEAKALDILVPQRLPAERAERPASVGNRAVQFQGRALERVAARGGHRLLRWLERERADARRLCAHDGQRALQRLQRERHRSWRARGSPACETRPFRRTRSRGEPFAEERFPESAQCSRLACEKARPFRRAETSPRR